MPLPTRFASETYDACEARCAFPPWLGGAARCDHRSYARNTAAERFVRRVARTPHYDGVKRDAKELAVIALFGIAPVDLTLVDPSKPGWRQV